MTVGEVTTWRIRADHPRILFNRDSRAPDGRPLLAVMRERFADPTYVADGGGRLEDLRAEMAALRWCVLGDRAAAREALNDLLAIGPPTGGELRDGYVAERLGLTYDWLHSYLEKHPLEKEQIEARMMEYVRRFRKAMATLPVFHNYAHAALGGYSAVILALANGPHDAELEHDLRTLQHFLEGEGMLLDAWAYEDGAWHEGLEYGLSECYAPLVQTLLAVKTATQPSIDYFARARRRQNDWINRYARYLITKRRPDWTYERDGDVLPNWVFVGWRTYTPMLITAHQYQDPVLYSYLRAVAERDPRAVSSNFRPTFLIVGKEPDAPPDLWKGLPLSARFGKGAFEHIFFRSGWGPDDTYVAVRAGDFFTHHQHLDAGHFSIYHRGGLAIDSGFYAGMYNDHWSNYASRTIAHNCVTVRNPAEQFEHYTANDGGQRIAGVFRGRSTQASPWQGTLTERLAHLHKEPHWRMGRVLACASDETAHYVAIDLTCAYNSTRFSTWENSAKISDYTRELVYLPGPQESASSDADGPGCASEDAHSSRRETALAGVVVVFDRVVATSADFEKTWLLHTVEKPTVPGGEEPAGRLAAARTLGRAEGNGLFWGDGPSESSGPATGPAGGLIRGTGDLVRVDRSGELAGTRYDGRMFLRALLPERSMVNLRGGPGFEFFCDGANRAVERRQRSYSTPTSPREAGQWRIEVSPAAPALETRFLVVMQLGCQGSLAAMAPVSRIGDDASPLVGALLGGVAPVAGQPVRLVEEHGLQATRATRVGVSLGEGTAVLFVPDAARAEAVDLRPAEVGARTCLLFAAGRSVADVRALSTDGRTGGPVPFHAAPGYVRIDMHQAGAGGVRVTLKTE